jgi:tetratricopeptide (TPR) repeat protein
MTKKVSFIALFLLFVLPIKMLAQDEGLELASISDEFENYYYESIKQTGIENFDKAILELEKCAQLQPNNEVVYFLLGKNYLYQKNYEEAYQNFQKAAELNPANRWNWVGMYDACYESRDFVKAIPIVQKLVEFKSEYKEDLTSLYMNTQQFDKALELINALNLETGTTEKRDNYKLQILQDVKYLGPEKDNLLKLIRSNPKEEENYIALIYLYSKSNQEEKANEIAKQLEKEIPTSDWAQVSLFKFHLNNNDSSKAVLSMNKVLKSEKIDKKIKHRIFNEFLIFAQAKPELEADLEKAIQYFENDKEVKVAKEIGKFFQAKKNPTKAIKFYRIHLNAVKDDIETVLLLLKAYTENGQFAELDAMSQEQLQMYPTQPELYYYNGLANNQLQLYKKAKDVLESGADFVIDNVTLEINFMIQLGEAFSGMGDSKKKEYYFKKANDLIIKAKK